MLLTRIITVKKGPDANYSMSRTQACLSTIKRNELDAQLDIEIFDAFRPDQITESDIRRYTYPLEGHSRKEKDMTLVGYKTSDIKKRIGCLLSHRSIWSESCTKQEPILILEHDAAFTRKWNVQSTLDKLVDGDILMINDPRGATRRSSVYHQNIVSHDFGIHSIDGVNEPHENFPDGLAGNSAYIITPKAANRALELIDELGFWPNDALLCKQFFGSSLKSIYPYITRVDQQVSTTTD